MTTAELSISPQAENARKCPRAGAGERWFFLALVVLQLLPIWSVPYFPSDDGPSHVYNAIVMREYNRPDRAAFREYFQISRRPDPNWFGHLVLAGLTYVFSGATAEKILVSGYVLLLPLAVRYALRAVNPASGWLAILSLPFVYNFLLQKGFYNFSYSLAVYFFLVGYWLKHHDQPSIRHGITLGLLSLLLYFCHLVSVVAAYLLIGVLILILVARDARRESLSVALRRHALMPLCAFAPTVLLALLFLARQALVFSDVSLVKKILKLGGLYSLALFDTRERYLAAALSLLLVAAVLWAIRQHFIQRRWTFLDGLLVVTVLYAILALVAPDKIAGGGLMVDRLVLYPFLVLILWLGTRVYQQSERRIVQTVSTAITLVFLFSRIVNYARVNDYLAEYLSVGPQVPAGSTLLSLPFSNRIYAPDGSIVSSRVFPMNHASGFLAVQRGLVDLTNYEAGTGYFPILFRPNRRLLSEAPPSRDIDTPPIADFIDYPDRSGGGSVDFVLLWLVRPEQLSDPDAKAIFRQLDERYEQIYTSRPRGYAKLYRRKDISSSRAVAGGK